MPGATEDLICSLGEQPQNEHSAPSIILFSGFGRIREFCGRKMDLDSPILILRLDWLGHCRNIPCNKVYLQMM
jgi:hypothetical protein